MTECDIGVTYSGTFQFECPKCGTIHEFESRDPGKQIKCDTAWGSGCGEEWVVGTPTVTVKREGEDR